MLPENGKKMICFYFSALFSLVGISVFFIYSHRVDFRFVHGITRTYEVSHLDEVKYFKRSQKLFLIKLFFIYKSHISIHFSFHSVPVFSK